MSRARIVGFLPLLALAAMFTCLSAGAAEQEHRHPPEDEAIHLKFYSHWMMPDNPDRSCCNQSDCYPTEIKYEGDKLYARRREDGKWLYVPPEKIEHNRDNPDGRNHVCALPPSLSDTILCFTLGAGI